MSDWGCGARAWVRAIDGVARRTRVITGNFDGGQRARAYSSAAGGLGCHGTSPDDDCRPGCPLRRSLRCLQNSKLLERSGAVVEANLLHDSTACHTQHRRTGKAHLAA